MRAVNAPWYFAALFCFLVPLFIVSTSTTEEAVSTGGELVHVCKRWVALLPKFRSECTTRVSPTVVKDADSGEATAFCPAPPPCPACPACPAVVVDVVAREETRRQTSTGDDLWNLLSRVKEEGRRWTDGLKANVLNISHVIMTTIEILLSFPELIRAVIVATTSLATVALAASVIYVSRLPSRVWCAIHSMLSQPPSPAHVREMNARIIDGENADPDPPSPPVQDNLNPEGKCARYLPEKNRYCKKNPAKGTVYCTAHV